MKSVDKFEVLDVVHVCLGVMGRWGCDVKQNKLSSRDSPDEFWMVADISHPAQSCEFC
jgi:hypothetical protein